MNRPEPAERFVRGCAWPARGDVAYPRADPEDLARLPLDTATSAQLPVGVRLELVGDAPTVELHYRTGTDYLGYRGAGAGTSFVAYRAGVPVDEAPAQLGAGTARLTLGTGDPDERVIVYLPEAMRPVVDSITPIGGAVAPPPDQPRWLAYGDSIAEGWVASSPAGAWPAIVGRDRGRDVINRGYAGAARGELATAEQLAHLPAAVISISHGTNCWSRVPFSAALLREGTRAFLTLIRHGHPHTPIVVTSPVVRPDAEATPNALGATLADLRAAIEDVATERRAAGDDHLTLVPGGTLLAPGDLADGIHPGDDGHRTLAAVFGRAVRDAIDPGGR